VPPPRRGFQGALALQYAIPGGHAVKGIDVSELFAVSLELEAQAGVKITDRFFLGAYVAAGGTAPSEDMMNTCRDRDVSCHGTVSRLGVFGKLDLLPTQAGNPWVGLGVGLESHTIENIPPDSSILGPASRQELELDGSELRLMGGIDYRAKRTVGFGAYGSLSVGTFEDVHLKDGTVLGDRRAAHVWFTLGLRGVLFP
jgi:hypothetical protein